MTQHNTELKHSGTYSMQFRLLNYYFHDVKIIVVIFNHKLTSDANLR